jgi:hypothetical protein
MHSASANTDRKVSNSIGIQVLIMYLTGIADNNSRCKWRCMRPWTNEDRCTQTTVGAGGQVQSQTRVGGCRRKQEQACAVANKSRQVQAWAWTRALLYLYNPFQPAWRICSFPHPMAYVEWFTPLHNPVPKLGIYQISRSTHSQCQCASIIPVSQIERLVHLIPKFGREINWTPSFLPCTLHTVQCV